MIEYDEYRLKLEGLQPELMELKDRMLADFGRIAE